MIRIALYYPMRIGLWQRVIRGIFQYARPHKPWVFSMALHADPRQLLRWKPDAIIGQVETEAAVELLQRVSIPVVDTSFSFHRLAVPRIRFDDVAIGKLAAEYFLQRGFQHFAFAGNPHVAFESARDRGYRQRLQRAGWTAVTLPGLKRVARRPDDLGPLPAETRNSLRSAPRRLAIFAAVDPLALRLSEACRDLGLRVPEDVALLGVNNDELICNLAFPPLSSVRLPAQRLGFEAARLLDRWLSRGRVSPRPQILAAAGIVTRQSTDIYATEDDVLNRALRFIKEHAVERISVGDVVAALDVSRSVLERRFSALLNRTPLDEIRRVQLDRARELLIETDHNVPAVAMASGFRDGKHLAMVFRDKLQTTPTQYRQQFSTRARLS